jgi:hypothetical protein
MIKSAQQRPKDGATRQAKFKDEQRKLGRRRAEYWVTDSERKELDALLHRLRSSS